MSFASDIWCRHAPDRKASNDTPNKHTGKVVRTSLHRTTPYCDDASKLYTLLATNLVVRPITLSYHCTSRDRQNSPASERGAEKASARKCGDHRSRQTIIILRAPNETFEGPKRDHRCNDAAAENLLSATILCYGIWALPIISIKKQHKLVTGPTGRLIREHSPKQKGS